LLLRFEAVTANLRPHAAYLMGLPPTVSPPELCNRNLTGHKKMTCDKVVLKFQALVGEPGVVHDPGALERCCCRKELPLCMTWESGLGQVGQ
jgi:hypothetical protein